MDYMLFLHTDESFVSPAPGTPEFGEWMGGWMAFNQKIIDGGHWIAGGSLQPTVTATTLRRAADGSSTVVDGPFAETKEQLGGFYLISAADLDEAMSLAEAVPLPAGGGGVEIRPMNFRPDAPQAG